jgi:hypothetical protein
MTWRLRLVHLIGDALAWPGDVLASLVLLCQAWLPWAVLRPVFMLAWYVRSPGDHVRCWCNRRAGGCNGPP